MKPYLQGLITGILLTVSAMMFMGANAMQSYDSFYDMEILSIVQNMQYGVQCIGGSVECDGGYVSCD